MVRSESQTAAPIAEFISGWLKQIGIGDEAQVVNDSQLTEIIGKGDYDMFEWGWTPFVDPDPMLSYFQCNQIATDPDDPTNYYNDANWCDRRYDALYKQQNVELDPAKRLDLVHQMLTRSCTTRPSTTSSTTRPDLQAYRTDRFTGWLRQPADDRPGAVLEHVADVRGAEPVAASTDSGGGGISTGAIVGIVVAGLLVLAAVAYFADAPQDRGGARVAVAVATSRAR